MTDFKYANDTFTIILTFTCTSLLIALMFVVINLWRHINSEYSKFRKIPLIILFVLQIVSIMWLFVSLWIYEYAEPFLILFDTNITISMILFYVYCKETLMMLFWTYANNNQDFVEQVVMEEDNRKQITQSEYPFGSTILFSRSKLQDVYIAYIYLTQGTGKVWCCWRRKMKSFKQALSFQKTNSTVLYFCLIASILASIIEYIVNLTEVLKFNSFNASLIIRFFIILMTVISVVYLQAFILSFKATAPFWGFKAQFMSIFIPKIIFNITGVIISLSQPKFDSYSKSSSSNLLYTCILSIIITIFSFIQILAFSSSKIKKIAEMSIIVNGKCIFLHSRHYKSSLLKIFAPLKLMLIFETNSGLICFIQQVEVWMIYVKMTYLKFIQYQ